MEPSRPTGRTLAVLVLFAGWTLFVWVGRIRNLAQEPGPIAEASRWSLLGSVAFTVLGLLLLATSASARLGSGRGPLRPVVAALGALTTGVWVVRALDIALGDHSIGFVVVHLVLAVVSIGLAVASWLALRPSTTAGIGGGGPSDGRLPSKRWVSL
jgi:hypothetical protein